MSVNIRKFLHRHTITTPVDANISTTKVTSIQSYGGCPTKHADCIVGQLWDVNIAVSVSVVYDTFESDYNKNIRERCKHVHTLNYQDMFMYGKLAESYSPSNCPAGHSSCIVPPSAYTPPGVYQARRERSANIGYSRTQMRVVELHKHGVGCQTVSPHDFADVSLATCGYGHSSCVINQTKVSGYKRVVLTFYTDEKTW